MGHHVVRQVPMLQMKHVHATIHVQVAVLNKVDGVIQVICHVVVYQVMIRKKTVP